MYRRTQSVHKTLRCFLHLRCTLGYTIRTELITEETWCRFIFRIDESHNNSFFYAHVRVEYMHDGCCDSRGVTST